MRTRFIGCEPSTQSLVLAPFVADDAECGVPRVELAVGELVGVTFRHGHKKCMFSTALQRFADHDAEGKRTRAAVWLAWPDHLQQLQRRVYYRVPPPPGRTIPVRVTLQPTRSEVQGSAAGESAVIHGELADLSAGGMRIRTENPEQLPAGLHVQVRFAPKHDRQTFELEAVCRHSTETESDALTLGLQFVGLDASERGRETLLSLARVVTEFHRGRPKRPSPALPARRHSR